MSNNGYDGWQPVKGRRKPPNHSPSPNKVKGEVPIKIGEKIHFAYINYERLSELISLFSEGKDSRSVNVWAGFFEAWLAGDVDRVSAAIAIMTGVGADEVYKASPPWETCHDVMRKAYNVFYYGMAEAPEDMEAEDKEKVPLANGSSRKWSFWKWSKRKPGAQDYSQVNSGT